MVVMVWFFQKKQGTTRVVPYAEAALRLEANSATGANISTGAALGAHVRVDRIVCTHRALIDTRTASDTICRNLVSHNIKN